MAWSQRRSASDCSLERDTSRHAGKIAQSLNINEHCVEASAKKLKRGIVENRHHAVSNSLFFDINLTRRFLIGHELPYLLSLFYHTASLRLSTSHQSPDLVLPSWNFAHQALSWDRDSQSAAFAASLAILPSDNTWNAPGTSGTSSPCVAARARRDSCGP